ncbi:prolyl 3-hydroxylase OGFOD1 isoform X2 [Rhineura floridana]|uniref:prolyl 3-hydroxylase OGFOD1 isoform X2 n=1 Tax=Rhineura floridana TaxID=261503 RepID=UPI002AC81155|nr:prolyl 3-hydroxylase OGFOD1 isoform X2 [Rhineura floridana]
MSGRRSRDRSVVEGGSLSSLVGEAAKKRVKREVRADFSAPVREQALREKVAAAWACKKALDHGSCCLVLSSPEAIVLDPVPFHHCIIPNFIQNEGFLEGLQKELLSLDFHKKCNDLYKFKQSDDLKKRREPHIAALRKVLFEEFRSWLSDVVQVELEPTIDLSCAKYEYTDTLLCHDDELEGRRIAFILYLVPPWDKRDGGTLDLFSTDDNFQPLQIVKSLVPSWNSLAFFEVSPVSFHQVAEVVSKGKCRLSVSGWFHGPSVARPARHVEPLLPRSPHIPFDHEILYEWINPVYLDMDSQAQIQEEFEDRSESLLKDFLKREKFQLICEALKKEGLRWSSRGPPNKRHYERAEEESLPAILKDCMELFRSEAFFLLLSNFTGLKLHFLAPGEEEDEKEGEGGTAGGGDSSICTQGESSREETTPSLLPEEHGRSSDSEVSQESGSSIPLCSGELRHWKKGCYTLVHDAQTTEFALDLLLFSGCEDWDVECGGFTSYIAKGEDEELLTVNPEMNCLALVYRDRETLKFVKYINHRSLKETAAGPEETGFWDFCFVYYE